MAELHVDIIDLGMVRVPNYSRSDLVIHRLVSRKAPNSSMESNVHCGRRVTRINDLLGIDFKGSARLPISRLCRPCFGKDGVTNGAIKDGVLIFHLFTQTNLDV